LFFVFTQNIEGAYQANAFFGVQRQVETAASKVGVWTSIVLGSLNTLGIDLHAEDR